LLDRVNRVNRGVNAIKLQPYLQLTKFTKYHLERLLDLTRIPKLRSGTDTRDTLVTQRNPRKPNGV